MPTRRSRAVLTCLLVDIGKYVPTDTIIDLLYRGRGPKSAVNQVHRGVHELRRAGVCIDAEQGSYRLDAHQNTVDIHVFTILCSRAQKSMALGDYDRALKLYEQALGIWRGPAFGEFEDMFPYLSGSVWEEYRTVALEGQMEAKLALERYREVIPELTLFQVEHPYRESVTYLLMLALYRSGRGPEALQFYDRYLERISEALGTDPGPQLAGLHLQILRQDAALLPAGHRSSPVSPIGWDEGSQD